MELKILSPTCSTLVVFLVVVPDKWSQVNNICGGKAQSPINIVTRKTLKDKRLAPFQFHNYQQSFKGTIKNNGHSGECVIPLDNQEGITCFEARAQTFNAYCMCVSTPVQVGVPVLSMISGGGLPDSYKAVQFHLHWGKEGGPGSEHTIDGEQYPMEVP